VPRVASLGRGTGSLPQAKLGRYHVSAARELIESRLSRATFTVMISAMMAVTALAIDMMLPAFTEMRVSFDLAPDSNALAPVVTFFFIGVALGTPILGPLSDALGRKPILYIGGVVYVAAAIGAALAPSLPLLFLARFVGGLGAAGPRVVALSVVRDAYEGQAMARVMSFVMAVFILVPVVAPSVGSLFVAIGPWQLTFWAIAAYGAVVTVWAIRLPETLHPDHRLALQFNRLVAATRIVLGHRFTMSLTLAQTAAFGFFASLIASSQLFIEDIFGLGDWFALIFAGQAAIVGVGVAVNTQVLKKVQIRFVLRGVFVGYILGGVLLVFVSLAWGGRPPLWAYLVATVPILFSHAFLMPNLNAASMLPMGAIAGTAAAVIGATSMLFGAVLGALIDRAYNGTVTPFAVSSLALALVGFALFKRADRIWDTAIDHRVEAPV